MKLQLCLVVAVATLLSACGPAVGPGPGGPDVYRISGGMSREIPARMEESVNSLRAAAGAPRVTLDRQLTAAAATHSRDMAAQNRPWHFGSDGSSPLVRVQRTGYPGQFLGEAISETYETELETLAAWMDQPDTRAIILDPRARNIGFAWYQEQSGKIWWTLVTGA